MLKEEKNIRSAARTIKACSTRWIHGRTYTWVDKACYGILSILLKPGCSSHRCIQHGLWHFRSATSSCPQCASLTWLEQPNWLKNDATWTKRPSLLVKVSAPPQMCWGRVPSTYMCNGNLPFYCRHVEPSNERVQDKCQTSHHIK